MDPDEIIRPQTEQTVWVFTQGPNQGQVAPPNDQNAQPVIRTTVYRRDGRVEVWQRSPDQGAEFGVLMPNPISYTDEKIAAAFQRDQDKAEATPAVRDIGGVPHERRPDGTWAPVVTTAGPAGTATAAQTPAAARTAREEAEIAKNAALPGPNPQGATEEERRGQDPRSETDAERQARGAKVIEAQGAAAAAAAKAAQPISTIKAIPQPDGSTKNVRVLVYPPSPENPQGKEEVLPSGVPGEPAPPTKPTIAAGTAGQPAVQYVPDPDNPGQVKAVPIPGAPAAPPKEPNVVTVNGRQGVWELGPDGKTPVFREVQGPQTGATNFTYPELRLQYGRISEELGSIYRDVYGRVGVGEGKITKEEADRLFAPIYQQANMRVTELNNIVDTQSSVWRQQQATAGNRLDAATRMAGQAFNLVGPHVPIMAPGTGHLAAGAIRALMGEQKSFAGGMGAFANEQLPGYLQAAMNLSPEGGLTPRAAPGVPGAVPGPAQAVPGVPPAGASDTTDIGGVPRVFTPAASGPDPRLAQAQQYLSGAVPQVPQININVGAPPPQSPYPAAQPGAVQAQTDYLNPATQAQRPSLQGSQRGMAGALMSGGFDQDVIEELWSQNTGTSLFGGMRRPGGGGGAMQTAGAFG